MHYSTEEVFYAPYRIDPHGICTGAGAAGAAAHAPSEPSSYPVPQPRRGGPGTYARQSLRPAAMDEKAGTPSARTHSRAMSPCSGKMFSRVFEIGDPCASITSIPPFFTLFQSGDRSRDQGRCADHRRISHEFLPRV